MAEKTVVYGNIVDPEDRRQLEERYAAHEDCLLWRSKPSEHVADDQTSVVYVDLDNPELAEAAFLVAIVTSTPNIKVVGKTSESPLEIARRVAKLGVSEVLTTDECLQRLQQTLDDLEKIAPPTERVTTTSFGIDSLVGESQEIAEVRRTLQLLSGVDFPSALILGETGTGKSLISKILHHTGLRSDRNLVEVNCSAIPDELFESELFGHAKGAFTDARREKVGLFEYAEKGTLFLDEVGNLSGPAQAKLLKILEDKKLRRIGDVDERDIDVRTVTATNLDLEKAIEEGRFREDLYFRLNLLTVRVPPLRERKGDIPGIAEQRLATCSTLYGKPDLALADSAIEELMHHKWPGNVRELANVIERAVLLATKLDITGKDVRAAVGNSRISAAERRQIVLEVPPQGVTLEHIEQSVVKQVLNMCDWNKTEAAKFLGISRPRLRRIINAAGLEQNRRER